MAQIAVQIRPTDSSQEHALRHGQGRNSHKYNAHECGAHETLNGAVLPRIPSTDLSYPLFPRGLEGLIGELRAARSIRSNVLLRWYCHDDVVFGQIFESSAPEIVKFFARLRKEGGILSACDPTLRMQLEIYLNKKFPTIEDVKHTPNLLRAFCVPWLSPKGVRLVRGERTNGLIRALIVARLIDPTWKPGMPSNRTGSLKAFSRRIVGTQIAERNRVLALKDRISVLDDLSRKTLNGGIYGLVGLRHTASLKAVARRVISLNVVSPVIPNEYEPPKGRASLYFLASVVGAELARSNFETWFKRKHPTLHSVDRLNQLVRKYLNVGLGKLQKCQELVKRSVASSEIPKPYCLTTPRGQISPYLLARVISDPKQLESNQRKAVTAYVKSIDDISDSFRHRHVLGKILGVAPTSRRLAKALIDRGWLSPVMPQEESRLRRGHRPSFYLDPKVVGLTHARENLNTWVRRHMKFLDDVPHSHRRALFAAFNRTRNPQETQVTSHDSLAIALLERKLILPIVAERALIAISQQSPHLKHNIVGTKTAEFNRSRRARILNGE